MRLANQDWDLSLMEGITGYYSLDFVKSPLAVLYYFQLNKMSLFIFVYKIFFGIFSILL